MQKVPCMKKWNFVNEFVLLTDDFWLLVFSSFNYLKMHVWSTVMLFKMHYCLAVAAFCKQQNYYRFTQSGILIFREV